MLDAATAKPRRRRATSSIRLTSLRPPARAGNGITAPVTPASDKVIIKAWSDICPGDFIRWRTPRFIWYGKILKIHSKPRDRSMLVDFMEEQSPRAIPDAKWYHAQFCLYGDEAEEHICVVDYHEWYKAPPSDPFIPEAEDAHDVWIPVYQAAEFLGWDEKRLRRMIRRGHITAHKEDGRWIINRNRLREVAAKHGWI